MHEVLRAPRPRATSSPGRSAAEPFLTPPGTLSDALSRRHRRRVRRRRPSSPPPAAPPTAASSRASARRWSSSAASTPASTRSTNMWRSADDRAAEERLPRARSRTTCSAMTLHRS
ncbi:MAG: hypothetical protein MZW92_08760 [Comamonadaceae bacterium]|nr:hypothetical protein [Comamonadaceae bacterium]